jgi:ABC-type transporter Mla subunit MlaD
MTTRTQQIGLGLFILAGVGLFAGLLFFFGGTPNLWGVRKEYYVLFDDARGLAPGAPVRRSGVRVGDVGALQLETDGRVRVIMLVEPKFVWRQHEEPTISRNFLTNDTAIELVPRLEPKPVNTEPVALGSVVVGKVPIDPRTLITQASDVLPTAQVSLDQIRISLQATTNELAEFARAGREVLPEVRRTNDRLQALLRSTNEFVPDAKKTAEDARVLFATWTNLGTELRQFVQVNEPRIARAIEQAADAIQNLNAILSKENRTRIDATIRNVADLSENVKPLVSKENQEAINKTLRNAADISDNLKPASTQVQDLLRESKTFLERLQKSTQNAEAVLENLRKLTDPLSNSGPQLAKNVTETADQANLLVRDLRELVRQFARDEGTINKLLTDPALYNNVNATAVNVQQLIPRLDRILRDLESFADKIARHPELLGVRGAVRPDSGLK